MKKFFTTLAIATMLAGGCAYNSAEAIEHFHNWKAQEDCILLCDSYLDDEGIIKGIHPTGPDTILNYYGTWKRQADGSLLVKYDKLEVRDAQGRINQERYSDLEFKLRYKANKLEVISQDAPSAMQSSTYGLGEYVWGNDKELATYMLDKFLRENGSFNGTVYPTADLTETLLPEFKDRIKQLEHSPQNPGHWFEAKAQGMSQGIFYVESDPCTIYRKVGNRLETIYKLGLELQYLERGGMAGRLDNSRARVVMFKERSNEYYNIFFAPDYFIVERVTADEADVAASLQAEVGLRQEYGPNPRVKEAKEKLGL